MKILPEWPPLDPWRFWIHFFFGLFFGAAIGWGVYLHSPFTMVNDSWTPLLLHVGIGALLVALIAGFWGDAFWKNLGNWWFP